MNDLTPMMRQYLEIKDQHQDKILFFRLGDFYEMFREDALITSELLGLTLTRRVGEPMCGIPYHSAPAYMKKLLDSGHKIAICEQLTSPGIGKGIVRREVTEVLTPGTVIEDSYLQSSCASYTAAFVIKKGGISLAFADLSTGEFKATSFCSRFDNDAIKRELYRFRPREILIQENLEETYPLLEDLLKGLEPCMKTTLPLWQWELDTHRRKVLDYFQLAHPRSLGLHEQSLEWISVGVLLEYLKTNTRQERALHIRPVEVYQPGDFLTLDEASARNLELIIGLRDHKSSSTLLGVLDHTKTACGARLLKSWILFPLKDLEALKKRQDHIALFCQHEKSLVQCRHLLARVLDFERLGAKLALNKATAQDVLALNISLRQMLALHALRTDELANLFSEHILTADELTLATSLSDRIEQTMRDCPSTNLNEGGLIREGFHQELDQLKHLKDHSQEVLEAYLVEEQTTWNLPQLKLKYNKIVGYFFELSKARAEALPAHFERKQSLLNAERFTTSRLKDMEETLLHAQERIIKQEKELFFELREKLKQHMNLFIRAANFTALMDVIQSLAWVALHNRYVRPELHLERTLRIIEARHPVVEHFLKQEAFVPNSLEFSQKDILFLLTGPNMAGKSTYLRQSALIVLMAQIGSFVPAQEASIGLVDKIFCRVGASDNLSGGESTFLVEMNETALILRNATEKSLIIMDEVGRGTSTKDGYSLAWAICEHLLDEVKAKTLFATHFHELTTLTHPAVRNFSLAVHEDISDIVFLRKVIDRAADHSYGIYVAKLAGIPPKVLSRSQEILESLETEKRFLDAPPLPRTNQAKNTYCEEREQIIEELHTLKIEAMTPLEALMRIETLREKALSLKISTQ